MIAIGEWLSSNSLPEALVGERVNGWPRETSGRSADMGRPFEKKYDSQFIIYFDGADKAAEQNAEYLVAKASVDGILDKTKIIELREIKGNETYDLSEYKSLAKGRVHVYIVGHGTESSQSVGGCRAEQLAKIINSLSTQKIKRISIVACHAGGNGSAIAPHRFVSELWDHAKGFVEEVSGYTGTVHLELGRYKILRRARRSQRCHRI